MNGLVTFAGNQGLAALSSIEHLSAYVCVNLDSDDILLFAVINEYARAWLHLVEMHLMKYLVTQLEIYSCVRAKDNPF